MLLFNKNRLLKVLVDSICIAVLIVAYKSFGKYGEPIIRGFYCDDESIRYPYNKDSTIESNENHIISCLTAIFTVLIVETLRGIFSKHQSLLKVIWSCYKYLLVFAFAILVSEIVTNIAKYSTGRLRPHFIEICDPFTVNPNLCSDPFSFQYITEYNCSDKYPERGIKEARLSFMSGHSSFAATGIVFTVLYIQTRVTWSRVSASKHLIQFLLITYPLWVGSTRIKDYWHHWSDVLAGLSLGSLTAIVSFMYISKLHKSKIKNVNNNINHKTFTSSSSSSSCDSPVSPC